MSATIDATKPVKNLPKDLTVHPTANIFPLLEGEAYLMLEQSVRETGVLDPITIWKGPDKGWYIIDGKNRWRVWNSLYQQDALPEGRKDLPFKVVEGDEVEVIETVMAKGMARRHLTSSQRAACIVHAESLREQAQESLGQDEPEGSPRLTGLSTEYLAKCSGTNRQYIFDGRFIQENAPDVLQRVISGELKINDAKALVKKKLSGEAETAGIDPEKVEKDTAPPAPEVVLDGEGNAVNDPALAAIFQARSRFSHAGSLANQLRAATMDCLDSAGGSILRLMEQEALSQISAIRKTLRQNQPHIVCPSCKGSGHEVTDSGNQSRKVCNICSGHKFLNVIQAKVWQGVPFEDKDDEAGTAAERPAAENNGTSGTADTPPAPSTDTAPAVTSRKARRKAERKARKQSGNSDGQQGTPEAAGEANGEAGSNGQSENSETAESGVAAGSSDQNSN